MDENALWSVSGAEMIGNIWTNSSEIFLIYDVVICQWHTSYRRKACAFVHVHYMWPYLGRINWGSVIEIFLDSFLNTRHLKNSKNFWNGFNAKHILMSRSLQTWSKLDFSRVTIILHLLNVATLKYRSSCCRYPNHDSISWLCNKYNFATNMNNDMNVFVFW